VLELLKGADAKKQAKTADFQALADNVHIEVWQFATLDMMFSVKIMLNP